MRAIPLNRSVKVESGDTKFVLIVSADLHIQSVFKALCRSLSIPIKLTFADDFYSMENMLKNKSFHLVIVDDALVSHSQWKFSAPVLWMGEQDSEDYIQKPLSVARAKMKIQKLLLRPGSVEIIGVSLQSLLTQMEQIAGYDTPVLLTGESGSGKELFARFIHQNSPRALKNFTTVHCGAVSEHLMESEFFGHKKGSFTGAVADKKGFFENSHQGTLFLDELGDLPLNLQAKLLRAVQDQKIRPVGALQEIEVDVRIISATNQHLKQKVQKKIFREDLFHRLAVIHLELPPLRERKEDISLLSHYFLEKSKNKYGKENLRFSGEALEYLKQYHYPGNIRELENMIEKAVLFSAGDIGKTDLNPEKTKEDSHRLDFEMPAEGVDLTRILRQTEKQILSSAIHRSKGNRENAAKLLKITPRSLKHRIHKYKLA